MGVAEIGGQGQHMATEVVTPLRTGAQHIGRKGRPKIDQPWPGSTRCPGDTSGRQEAPERGVDGRTPEGTVPQRDEQMLIIGCPLCALDHVRLEGSAGGGGRGTTRLLRTFVSRITTPSGVRSCNHNPSASVIRKPVAAHKPIKVR